MMSQGFAFLDEPFTSAFEPPAPVNVFTISGLERREAVESRMLAFLLDPNERHRFGTTFIDALLMLLDGAETATGARLAADRLKGSSEWSAEAETSGDGARSEVLLENESLDVAIVVESPSALRRASASSTVVARARGRRSTVVASAIAPTHRAFEATTHRWGSRITYDDLFDAADAALYDVGPMADQRSIELYAQFRETTSERIATMTIEQEQQRLDELWAAIQHRQDQVLDFFTALDSVNAVLVARGTRLQRAIGERLDAAGIEHAATLVNAGDHAWGRGRGERALVYVGFTARTGGAIELLLGWLPRTGTFGYAVTASQSHHRPTRPWDHIPLGLPFDADEDAVADRFTHLALRWTAGERPD